MDVLSVTMTLETLSLQICQNEDWQAFYDPNLGADIFQIPGFGITAAGQVYYDPQNVDTDGKAPNLVGEAAQVGVRLWGSTGRSGPTPAMCVMRVLPSTGHEVSPYHPPYWTATHTLDLAAPGPPKPGYWTAPIPLGPMARPPRRPKYWTHPHPIHRASPGPPNPPYWAHAHPPPPPLVPVQPVTRFV